MGPWPGEEFEGEEDAAASGRLQREVIKATLQDHWEDSRVSLENAWHTGCA